MNGNYGEAKRGASINCKSGCGSELRVFPEKNNGYQFIKNKRYESTDEALASFHLSEIEENHNIADRIIAYTRITKTNYLRSKK